MATRKFPKHAKASIVRRPAAEPPRYMIQVLGVSRMPSVLSLRRKLAPYGVKVDVGYRPLCVNPAAGNYVVRGWASDEARTLAESRFPGLQFYRDSRIGPA